MTWLITGGAGYIGAHVTAAMAAAGESVVVLDDLSSGTCDRLPGGVPLVRASVLDRAALEAALRGHQVTGVVHIAAKKQVGESVEQPLRYYRENVEGLRILLEAVVAAGIRRFVFSSSAAVYGLPDTDLVTEDTPCIPINPYGETKLAGEWLVRAAGRAHGIGTVSLRYFNVAGAANPRLGDTGASNLLPLVFRRLTDGEAPIVYGNDYPTPDGSCIRDYVHVADVASAHLAAARRIAADGEGTRTELTVNIGRGEGVSVLEMIDRIRAVTGHHRARPVIAGRRPGDPARVVAAADLARKELGWSAEHDIDSMIASAWDAWCLRHPEARR